MKKIFLSSFLFIFFSFNLNAQCWLQIDSGSGATLTYHSVGIQSNGTLWTWGNNSYGQLGDGTTTDKLVPTQIGTDTDWAYVATGTDATYAIKQNGTFWAWGRNNKGQLSDGTTISRSTPAQVIPGTTWIKVSAGTSYIVAQKTNSTLWSCGLNSGGALGNPGAGSEVLNLTQISTDTDWLDFECGHRHTVLQKASHTIWGFGEGQDGCLVSGSDGGYSVPTQIMSGTNWTHSIAGLINSMFRKNDGTIWGVGQNLQGVLGVGNNDLGVYTLTQAGTANDWASIESSSLHAMALKNNGTLWSSGLNSYGQLGIGSTAYNINIFNQVGTATNWAKVRCGRTHTLALDTNGTLWAWGDNSQGQLGNGTTTNSLVPIQIGTTCTLNTPDFKQSSVRLLTNPVEDIVQLSFNSDGTKKIEVYNSLGVLLTTKTISSDFISFDVSGYASGVYFVKCSMGDKVETVKVVKK